MVTRGYISCETCSSSYILRVGVGLEKNCIHTFDCISCKTPISINVHSNPPVAVIQANENCWRTEKNDEGIVINLHPAFSFKKEDIHQEKVFASLEYSSMLFEAMRKRPGKFQDMALQWELPNCKNIWAIVANIIKQNQRPTQEKAKKILLNSYISSRKKYDPSISIKSEVDAFHDFFESMFYPKISNLTNPIKSTIAHIKSSRSDEYEKFLAFYRAELQEEHLNRYISTLNDYFRNFEQFRQMLTHARIDSNDIKDRVVGSKRFDEIRLYYGQAYEALTSNYTVLACINNLNEGRNFDQFQSMTLNKYIRDVEKSKKSNPFRDKLPFGAFTSYEDSALRNGSHHASFWHDGEIVIFRSGGTGAKHEIPYSEYIHFCNGITISLSALFSIEQNFFWKN